MKPSAFIYHRPKSVAEAVQLLADYAAEDARIIAGGQSLIPIMAFRLAAPCHLIDINRVDGLDAVEIEGERVRIGARVRHAAFHQSVVDGPLGALMSVVVHNIAHAPIRSRGTFCGSLVQSDPASEWCLVATTLDAEMVAVSTNGARTMSVEEFFLAAMTTALEAEEMLTSVTLPILPLDTQFGFEEFSRRKGDYGLAMALAVFRTIDGRMSEVRLGIGGAEDHPRRLSAVEAWLETKEPSEAAFREAAEMARELCEPISDERVSEAYRRDLVYAMVLRALERADGRHTC